MLNQCVINLTYVKVFVNIISIFIILIVKFITYWYPITYVLTKIKIVVY